MALAALLKRPTNAAAASSTSTTPDLLSDLRFSLDIMPGSRKYVFTPAARAEILSKMYGGFVFGSAPGLFLPNGTTTLPPQTLLGEYQLQVGFAGAGKEDPLAPGRSCSHIFKKGESCYRCKDCALDDSCVLCARCFHATNHEGHNVSFFIAQQSGGCCDCGDEEAWRRDIRCPHHPPAGPSDPQDTTPRHITHPLPNTVPPAPNYAFRVTPPPGVKEAIRKTVAFALDFILDTLDYSPDTLSLPGDEADLRLQPSADPMLKDQYCVVLWNDDKHSFDEVAQILAELLDKPLAETKAIARKLDENGREIIEMGSNAGRLVEIAQALHHIDLGVTIRRAYDTFCEQVVGVMVEWLLDLTRARMGTDTLVIRECIAQELLAPRRRDAFTKHLTPPCALILEGEVPNAARMDTLLLYHTRLWRRPRLSLKEIYASVISVSRAHKLVIAGHFANIYHRVIDAYLLVDREAETSIKYFALQLFTVPSVSGHIARNHRLVERLLAIITSFFTNRISDKRISYPPGIRGDTSAPMSFSPPGPVDVDSFPFKSKRFMPVFSDLRYLASTAQVQSLITSPSSNNLLGSFAQTCSLFMCLNPNKRAVQSHVEYETDAWISVFNVTLSLSRVIKVFGEAFGREGVNVKELVRGIEGVLGEIGSVTGIVPSTRGPVLDQTKFPIGRFHSVRFGERVFEVVEFDVSDGWVSFHHSLHWLLAEMAKHVHLLDEAVLARDGGVEGGLKGLFWRGLQVGSEQDYQRRMLSLLDYPLRVLAMIAQIRTNLWVRNGFAIRGQLLHYRDYMLRELCYDQDLYLLQTALVVLPPSLVLVSLLDRFALLAFFTGRIHDTRYADEPTHLGGMLEELFYVLITLLNENANASRMPVPSCVRREVVHALAVGPCSYSDLVKRVAERLVDDVCFEGVLRDVAIFRPPEGAGEMGTYELKEAVLLAEVDPFFYHYARNRREEVEGVLRKRRGEDVVVPPRLFGVTSGPFAGLTEVYETETFVQILFFAIWGVLEMTGGSTSASGGTTGAAGAGAASGPTPPSAEAVLDQVLHLVMLGVCERPDGFAKICVEKDWKRVMDKRQRDGDAEMESTTEDTSTSMTLAAVLARLGEHETYRKTYRARVDWALDRIARVFPEEVSQLRGVTAGGRGGSASASGGGVGGAEDARKKAARRRQEAIMKQMKAQQASFLDAFGDEADSPPGSSAGSRPNSRIAGGAMADVDSDGDERMDGDGSDEMLEEEESFGTCIVCQEELDGGKIFGALGLVQPSRLVRKMPVTDVFLEEALDSPVSLDRFVGDERMGPTPGIFPPPVPAESTSTPPGTTGFTAFPASQTRFGLHASVCSHMMHLECFQSYSVNIRQRHRAQVTRNHPECIPRKEYICPLCKSLGNVFLPVTKGERYSGGAWSASTTVKNTRGPGAPGGPSEVMSFSDWARHAGIHILKSRPDPLMDSLQTRNGTGEFCFWAAQDPGYASVVKKGASSSADAGGNGAAGSNDPGKMLDSLMFVAKSLSQQSRHLRERYEPEAHERGFGIYLPEELVGYTLAAIEVAQRGVQAQAQGHAQGTQLGMVIDGVSEAQSRMIRGLIACLSRLVSISFKAASPSTTTGGKTSNSGKRAVTSGGSGVPANNESDAAIENSAREAVRQAIVKRLLPEWTRSSLAAYSYPLLLRDPLTILVETAAVAPGDMLKHVVVLLYYACLARTAVGIVLLLQSRRGGGAQQQVHQFQQPRNTGGRTYERLFGDVRIFFLSVVRHSSALENITNGVFEMYGEAKIERLFYAFTLPFLRRAAILCRSVLPGAFSFPTSSPSSATAMDPSLDEYTRLLVLLGIPPLSSLPSQETLQNALAGWCAHYGQFHSATSHPGPSTGLNALITLDYPAVYRLAKLPLILDSLFNRSDQALLCTRCETYPTDAAVCLVCGATVCMQSHCCADEEYGGRGECNMHTRECGGTVGVFYCVKRCSVLYLNAGNGTFTPSPYLDTHGEVDLSMSRRGRRQYLHHARWELIRKTWLSHGIPSTVARKLESSMDNGGWETL